MNSIINEHCTTISNQRRTISTEQLKSLFDLIVLELNNSNHSTMDDYYKIINTLKTLCGLTLNDYKSRTFFFHAKCLNPSIK